MKKIILIGFSFISAIVYIQAQETLEIEVNINNNNSKKLKSIPATPELQKIMSMSDYEREAYYASRGSSGNVVIDTGFLNIGLSEQRKKDHKKIYSDIINNDEFLKDFDIQEKERQKYKEQVAIELQNKFEGIADGDYNLKDKDSLQKVIDYVDIYIQKFAKNSKTGKREMINNYFNSPADFYNIFPSLEEQKASVDKSGNPIEEDPRKKRIRIIKNEIEGLKNIGIVEYKEHSAMSYITGNVGIFVAPPAKIKQYRIEDEKSLKKFLNPTEEEVKAKGGVYQYVFSNPYFKNYHNEFLTNIRLSEGILQKGEELYLSDKQKSEIKNQLDKKAEQFLVDKLGSLVKKDVLFFIHKKIDSYKYLVFWDTHMTIKYIKQAGINLSIYSVVNIIYQRNQSLIGKPFNGMKKEYAKLLYKENKRLFSIVGKDTILTNTEGMKIPCFKTTNQ